MSKAIEAREKLTHTCSYPPLPPKLLKFLYNQDNHPNLLLILLSFTSFQRPLKTPVAGRPIAASHSYITRPVSIFVDEVVKPSIVVSAV